MGVRTQSIISLSVGFGASLNDSIFQRDITELLDTLDRATASVFTMAALEADTAIPMGDVTQGRLLYIEADGEIEVNLDGTGTDPVIVTRPINPASSSAADVTAFLFTTATFASVHLTNPSATTAVRVRILIAGDLVS